MSDPTTTLVVANDNDAPRKGGGQPGNRNSTRHGLRAAGLPKGCMYLQGQLTAFRREIRNELVAARSEGNTTTYQEVVLQSMVRHETRALLAARWLRKEGDGLKIEQRTALLREIGNATDARDRCVKELGLDVDPQKRALDAMYSIPNPYIGEQK